VPKPAAERQSAARCSSASSPPRARSRARRGRGRRGRRTPSPRTRGARASPPSPAAARAGAPSRPPPRRTGTGTPTPRRAHTARETRRGRRAAPAGRVLGVCAAKPAAGGDCEHALVALSSEAGGEPVDGGDLGACGCRPGGHGTARPHGGAVRFSGGHHPADQRARGYGCDKMRRRCQPSTSAVSSSR
jgi:hypothetical protein